MRLIALFAALLLTIAATGTALAHHGWAWTTGGNIQLTGLIKSTDLGYPHGVVEVDADGDVWTVEVGQPWRNERAGLENGDFSLGREIKVIGQPSSNTDDRLLKAEEIYFDGTLYDLYPGRD